MYYFCIQQTNKPNKMLDLNNKTVLNREIKKVKVELKNCKGLITKAILEEELEYLESKKFNSNFNI